MAHVRFYAGIAIILFGIVAVTGLVPLSVAASSVSVSCSGYPSSGCAVTAPVTNSGTSGFTAPFTAYFVYKNTQGQVVLIDKQAWSSGQASVSDIFPTNLPGEGTTNLGYSVTVFFWDANGAPMGVSASQTFSVPILFTIDYIGVGSITVSPAGAGVSQGATTGLVGGQYYAAYWESGTVLTVTTSGGVAPVTTSPSGGSNCPASGAGFVCTITVSESTGLPIIEGANPNVSQPIIWIGNTAAGTPSSVCLSSTTYTPGNVIYGTCNPTGSFSLQVPSGYTWSGNLWSLQAQGSGTTVYSGNSTTVSLSFSTLQPKVTFSSGVASLNLVETSIVPITCSGTSCGNTPPSSSGCTLSPSSNAGLDVLVVTQAGTPIPGALVTAAGASGVTDKTGHALLCNFPVPGGNLVNSQGTVTVSAQASGYSSNSESANVIEGQTTDATIQLSGGSGFGGTGFIIGLVAMVAGALLVITDLPGKRKG